MKAAGYPSGKYTGNATVLIVGSNSDPGPQEMQIVQNGLQALGFKTTIKAVPQQTMYSKFCGYVKAQSHRVPDGRLDRGLSPTRTRCCSCRSAARRSSRSTTPTGRSSTTRRSTTAIDSGVGDHRPDAAAPGRVRASGQGHRRRRAGDPGDLGQQRPGRGVEGPRRSRRLERRLEPVVAVPRVRIDTTESIDPTGASLRRGPPRESSPQWAAT